MSREPNLEVRPMIGSDLPEARRLFRLAFGTYLSLPEPESFLSDREYVTARWKTTPEAAYVAELNGEIVGSNLGSRWGSLGLIGPLSVRPDLWDKGVGQALMKPVLDQFDNWNLTASALFTFSDSPKHVALYRRFGFWPGSLTAVMGKECKPSDGDLHLLSEENAASRDRLVEQCRILAGEIHPGLDLSSEIRAVEELGLGETVLVRRSDAVSAFAICHLGEGTEAGAENCYVKFAAARSEHFSALLDCIERLATTRGLNQIEAGMNYARIGAMESMIRHGYRAAFQGVAMVRPSTAAVYNRPDAYVIDDWR